MDFIRFKTGFLMFVSNLLCLNAVWYNRKKTQETYYRDIMQIPRFKEKEEKYSNSNQSKLFYFLYRGIFYSK